MNKFSRLFLIGFTPFLAVFMIVTVSVYLNFSKIDRAAVPIITSCNPTGPDTVRVIEKITVHDTIWTDRHCKKRHCDDHQTLEGPTRLDTIENTKSIENENSNR